jgi:hypothetical protein
MSRGWPFLGGILIATSLIFMNLTNITTLSSDLRDSLLQQRKKLDEIRSATPNEQRPAVDAPAAGAGMSSRVGERVKKMWNQDVEKGVRRLQRTDWARVGRTLGEQVKRATERIGTSMGRISEDSKKST